SAQFGAASANSSQSLGTKAEFARHFGQGLLSLGHFCEEGTLVLWQRSRSSAWEEHNNLLSSGVAEAAAGRPTLSSLEGRRGRCEPDRFDRRGGRSFRRAVFLHNEGIVIVATRISCAVHECLDQEEA